MVRTNKKIFAALFIEINFVLFQLSQWILNLYENYPAFNTYDACVCVVVIFGVGVGVVWHYEKSRLKEGVMFW